MRRLLLFLCVAGFSLAACSDDDGGPEAADPPTSTAAAGPTTPTEARPVDSTFVAEDVDALCDDLEALADIDPDADPTQEAVDRLRTIAESAPAGVAEPLHDVAAFGQSVVDGDPTSELQSAALEAATILIAYGNEACAIDVPLFDALAGV